MTLAKLVLSAFLIAPFAVGATEKPVADSSCPDRLEKLGAHLRQTVEARVALIQSAEDLTHFLFEVSEFGAASFPYLEGAAEVLWTEGGPEEARKVALNLLSFPTHTAKDSIRAAILAYAEGHSDFATLAGWSLPTYDPIEFSRWAALGETIIVNSELRQTLRLAIDDYRQFNLKRARVVDSNRLFFNALDGLKKLNNKHLVGQLVELFLSADRLTRLYIVDQVFVPERDGDKLVFKFRGETSASPGANAKEAAIESVLRRQLPRLQEEAYFQFRGEDLSHPALPEPKVWAPVAIRVLKRFNYDMNNLVVEYAAGVLTKFPHADAEVDETLTRLLEGGRIRAALFTRLEVSYAELELQLLRRNASGLSHIRVDLRHSSNILATKTTLRLFLVHILQLHDDFGLQNIPDLKKLALDYFRQFPESLSELPANRGPLVTRFKIAFELK